MMLLLPAFSITDNCDMCCIYYRLICLAALNSHDNETAVKLLLALI